MQKKKIIVLLVVLLIIAAVAYFVFFTADEATPWTDLTDEEKVDIFQDWFEGQGSVYIKPGTNEFDALIEEVKALYEAAGIEWDEQAFIEMYEAANGSGSSGSSSTGSSSGSGGAISISNRPGTNEYNP